MGAEKKKNGLMLVIVGIIILIAVAIAYLVFSQKTDTNQAKEPDLAQNNDAPLAIIEENAVTSEAMPVPNEAGETPKPETEVVVETPPEEKEVPAIAQPEVKTFTLVAKNFSFSVPEIRVKKGDTVKVILQNESGFHDFVLDEFNVRTKQTNSGETAEVQFLADKTGEFEYYCSVGSHRAMGMKGKLIVE